MFLEFPTRPEQQRGREQPERRREHHLDRESTRVGQQSAWDRIDHDDRRRLLQLAGRRGVVVRTRLRVHRLRVGHLALELLS